jgi:hypothetical protein
LDLSRLFSNAIGRPEISPENEEGDQTSFCFPSENPKISLRLPSISAARRSIDRSIHGFFFVSCVVAIASVVPVSSFSLLSHLRELLPRSHGARLAYGHLFFCCCFFAFVS